MSRRYRVYVGVIALLVVVNGARWWLQSPKEADGPVAHGGIFLPEDFRLRLDAPDTGTGATRDLFQSRGGRVASAEKPHGPIRRVAAVPKPAPVKTTTPPPAPSVPAEAESGLSKLRLLGVVFHAGQRQAYLAQDKENLIASAGDTVFGQYAVDRVTVDAVELRDLKNNATRRIPVSGK